LAAGIAATGLGAQALAAFGAAGVQHTAATHGSHAGTETMAAFAHEVAGLIRSFHGDIPWCSVFEGSVYNPPTGCCQ
jgi:hypothetical protein